MATVCITGLTKRYGNVVAVNRLDLEIAAGELVALLGPSGCGKTTTLRMVAGLLPPTAGDVLFDGRSVLAVPPERRGAVMVFQNHLLFPHLTVAENIGFGLKMRGVDKAAIQRRVSDMLDLVQLPGFAQRRPNELSGGQQQRVALARALVIEPQVLLLDEPLANLDANLRLEMRQLIRTIQQTIGITTIFVTHDQEEAVMLADRIALMDKGLLLQFGPPRTFYERPASVAVARFFRNENFLPGIKQGAQVKTAWENFRLSPGHTLRDGPVWLTIRPEHCQIEACQPINCLAATVVNTIYMGSYTQVQVAIGEWSWSIQAPTNLKATAGDIIRLSLPVEHIWCMPR